MPKAVGLCSSFHGGNCKVHLHRPLVGVFDLPESDEHRTMVGAVRSCYVFLTSRLGPFVLFDLQMGDARRAMIGRCSFRLYLPYE